MNNKKAFNSYSCFFTKIDNINEKVENIEDEINEEACWMEIKRKIPYYGIMIEVPEYGINIKYIKDIVNIVSKITLCTLQKKVNINYINIKLFENYPKSLLILDLIRLLWWSPKCANIEKYLINLIEEFKKNEEQDIIKLITSLISKHYDNKNKNYYEGDHCFFYKETKTKTLKDFNNLVVKNFNNNVGMRDFLYS